MFSSFRLDTSQVLGNRDRNREGVCVAKIDPIGFVGYWKNW